MYFNFETMRGWKDINLSQPENHGDLVVVKNSDQSPNAHGEIGVYQCGGGECWFRVGGKQVKVTHWREMGGGSCE